MNDLETSHEDEEREGEDLIQVLETLHRVSSAALARKTANYRSLEDKVSRHFTLLAFLSGALALGLPAATAFWKESPAGNACAAWPTITSFSALFFSHWSTGDLAFFSVMPAVPRSTRPVWQATNPGAA